MDASNVGLSTWQRALALGGVVLSACCVAGEEPWFEDVALSSGLDFTHASGHDGRYLMPEIMGGGVALADLDGDGDLDVYFVQSGTGLTSDGKGAGTPNRLYLNQGDGTFEEAAGGDAADAGYGMGVAAGDVDNDGDVDLYVTNVGPNVLLINDGDARFSDASGPAGVGDAGWGTAAAFMDLNADEHLDLFVVNYISWSLAAEPDCYVDGILTYCAPEHYNAPAPDRVYRNDGGVAFTDMSAATGLNLVFGNGLGIIGEDFDGDDRTDVFVANDMMSNQLWVNRGSMRFRDEALTRGVAADAHGVAKAGMGVAAADVDDDGDVDLLVVNLQNQTDSFFRNEGTHFTDTTARTGLAAITRRYTRFGVVMADFDNDGWLDLYEANGRINHGEVRVGDVFAEPNTLLRGRSRGRFVEVLPTGGTREALLHTSRGVAVGDLNDDGGLDLLVMNRDARPYLLMNRVSHRGNWVRFRVVLESGRDAHGAIVSGEAGGRRLRRSVQTAGSYLASNDPRVHFGIGRSEGLRNVSVRWPGGSVERFGDFAAGSKAVLARGSSGEGAP